MIRKFRMFRSEWKQARRSLFMFIPFLNLHKPYLFRILVFSCLIVSLSFITPKALGKPSELENPLIILSPEKIDIELESGKAKTKETITIQNNLAKETLIEFCMVLEPNTTCKAKFENSLGDFLTLNAVTIHQSEDAQAKANDDGDSKSNTATPLPPEYKPISGDLSLSAGGIRTFRLQFTATFSETKGIPKEWGSGFLVAQTTDDTDAISDNIPLTISSPKKETSLTLTNIFKNNIKYLTPGRIITIALAISFSFGVGAAVLSLFRDPDLAKHLLRADKANPLSRFRMGISEWKPEASWATSLVTMLGLFAAISKILPKESAILSASAWSAYGAMFTITTAIAAFVYNSTTRSGPTEDEEGKSIKEGLMVIWVLSAVLLTGWALLSQLGMQTLMLESLRADPETIISDGLINLFQILLIVLTIYSAVFYIPRGIKRSLNDQELSDQTNLLVPQPYYIKTFRNIKNILKDFRKLEDKSKKQSFVIAQIQEYIKDLHTKLVDLMIIKELKNKQSYDQSESNIVAELFHLFSCNFKMKLDKLVTGEVEMFLDGVIKDIDKAIELIDRRKDEKVVPIAMYTSLNAPCTKRATVYKATKDEVDYYIGIAIAQLTDVIELDKVLDVDQHLFPNITTSLDNMNTELGSTGDDLFYKDLKKILLEEGKNDLMTANNGKKLKKELKKLKVSINKKYLEYVKENDKDGEIIAILRSCLLSEQLDEFKNALQEEFPRLVDDQKIKIPDTITTFVSEPVISLDQMDGNIQQVQSFIEDTLPNAEEIKSRLNSLLEKSHEIEEIMVPYVNYLSTHLVDINRDQRLKGATRLIKHESIKSPSTPTRRVPLL